MQIRRQRLSGASRSASLQLARSLSTDPRMLLHLRVLIERRSLRFEQATIGGANERATGGTGGGHGGGRRHDDGWNGRASGAEVEGERVSERGE